jgi:transcriptional regulator with XRE-family HTH domain
LTADELRAIRLELGLTLEAMARELGVSETSVWRWEHGAVPISRRTEISVRALYAKRR